MITLKSYTNYEIELQQSLELIYPEDVEFLPIMIKDLKNFNAVITYTNTSIVFTIKENEEKVITVVVIFSNSEEYNLIKETIHKIYI